MRPSAARARRSERGAALVELAFGMSALTVIMVGTVDFGRVFYFSMELNAAARAGAQYGAYSLSNSSDPSGIQSAATAAAPNIGQAAGATGALTSTDVTLGDISATGNTSTAITRAQIPKCAPSDGASPGSWANPTSAQPWTCSSTCGAGLTLVCYVKVTVTKSFATLAPYPGIPNTLSISRSAIQRRE